MHLVTTWHTLKWNAWSQVDKLAWNTWLQTWIHWSETLLHVKFSTVVGETLAVFRLPQIRKNCQCLNGQVGKTFLEISGGNYNFSEFREVFKSYFWKVMNFSTFSRFFRIKLCTSYSHVLTSHFSSDCSCPVTREWFYTENRSKMWFYAG